MRWRLIGALMADIKPFNFARSQFYRRVRKPSFYQLRPNRSVPPLAQPIEASLAKPDLYAPTSVSISASVIGVENVHVPVLMMMQPSL